MDLIMTTGDRYDLEMLLRDSHGNLLYPMPVPRPTATIRHREDQAWIAKVTEGMRKDIKNLYEERMRFTRRELHERIANIDQDRRNAKHQVYVKDIELRRALETVGRQQIELEELRKERK
jgi:hypothetical protein